MYKDFCCVLDVTPRAQTNSLFLANHFHICAHMSNQRNANFTHNKYVTDPCQGCLRPPKRQLGCEVYQKFGSQFESSLDQQWIQWGASCLDLCYTCSIAWLNAVQEVLVSQRVFNLYLRRFGSLWFSSGFKLLQVLIFFTGLLVSLTPYAEDLLKASKKGLGLVCKSLQKGVDFIVDCSCVVGRCWQWF